MTLFLQDPDDADSCFLLEAILEACNDAAAGGAIFAFASPAGSKLLLDDEHFIKFLKRNKFHLILGLDGITDLATLDVVASAMQHSKNLIVRFFLHDRPATLFHPKLCWFRNKTGGVLFVGSGNLTVGGLRSNWEAFTSTAIGSSQIDGLEGTLTQWTTRHASSLFEIDHPKVRERAKANNEWVRLVTRESSQSSGRGSSKGNTKEDLGTVQAECPVLIAEIPRSGNRWNQANFDLYSYQSFFGARPGTQRRILLQNVAPNGVLGDIESRPSVAVASHNYRFELDAAARLPYPASGRPIGVFLRLAARSFRYALIMPSSKHHKKLSAILNHHWTGSSTQMRRIQLSTRDLMDQWPDGFLWTDS